MGHIYGKNLVCCCALMHSLIIFFWWRLALEYCNDDNDSFLEYDVVGMVKREIVAITNQAAIFSVGVGFVLAVWTVEGGRTPSVVFQQHSCGRLGPLASLRDTRSVPRVTNPSIL